MGNILRKTETNMKMWFALQWYNTWSATTASRKKSGGQEPTAFFTYKTPFSFTGHMQSSLPSPTAARTVRATPDWVPLIHLIRKEKHCKTDRRQGAELTFQSAMMTMRWLQYLVRRRKWNGTRWSADRWQSRTCCSAAQSRERPAHADRLRKE